MSPRKNNSRFFDKHRDDEDPRTIYSAVLKAPVYVQCEDGAFRCKQQIESQAKEQAAKADPIMSAQHQINQDAMAKLDLAFRASGNLSTEDYADLKPMILHSMRGDSAPQDSPEVHDPELAEELRKMNIPSMNITKSGSKSKTL